MKEPRVYGSRWAKARVTFLRDNPLCVMCQQQGRIEAATVVDHIEPHRLKEALMSGNTVQIGKAQKLFWDRKNWQSLCTSHHSSTKQRQEKSGHVAGCTADGMPIDPNSHWNR